MDFQEIAEKAYKKTGTDKFWDLPERYAYFKLEQLYDKYKIGNISKENSIIEKQKIEKDYLWDRQQYENALNTYREYNKNRINKETLLAELEKANSKTIMVEKALQIIANDISDDTFVQRNLDKFKNLDF